MRPSPTRPIGPVSGLANAVGPVESDLRTKRAACTWPPKTTTPPRPAAAPDPATATASSRFAGPSAPAAEPGRIAPVTTIGSCPSCTRSQSSASSSIVSVPLVTTTPRPSAAAARAASATAKASSRERCTPGRPRTLTASRPATAPRPGTVATSAAASSCGTARAPRIAIVPPAATTLTGRTGSSWVGVTGRIQPAGAGGGPGARVPGARASHAGGGRLGRRLVLQPPDQVGDVGRLLLQVALVLLQALQPLLAAQPGAHPAPGAAAAAAVVSVVSVSHLLTPFLLVAVEEGGDGGLGLASAAPSRRAGVARRR